MSLLSVRDLTVAIPQGDFLRGVGSAHPVDGVSFDIAPGETFALLGESGCGKSMTALALMRLLPEAARIVGGTVSFGGKSLTEMPESQMRKLRGGGMAMIFQEPGTSLNPVMTIGRQIEEAIELHGGKGKAVELLDAVGIPDAVRRVREYPFQLSGGMKQRAMIAMALAGDPQLLIADEPTTALDVTIQAQILDLLAGLQDRLKLSVILITHDLGVIAQMCHRVAVMYAGKVVEAGLAEDIFERPVHPYTQGLLRATPRPDEVTERMVAIEGLPPNLIAPPQGCAFAVRCNCAGDNCCHQPDMISYDEDRMVSCWCAGQRQP